MAPPFLKRRQSGAKTQKTKTRKRKIRARSKCREGQPESPLASWVPILYFIAAEGKPTDQGGNMTNRWLQLVASVIAMVMIANLQYAWTMFVRPIQEATGWTLSDIQWGFTLFILFETWVMPMEGWLIDRI